MSQPSAPLPPSFQRPPSAQTQTAAALSCAAMNQLKTVAANNCRLKAVAERLQLYFNDGVPLATSDVFHLIYAIARGIDYALSNNDIPGVANQLPLLIKQVFQCQNEPMLRSAIMVLMISVKNACKNSWFLKKDAEELLCMSNELSSSFCMAVSPTTVGNSNEIISKIMARFYPQLKFFHLVASFEVKHGYDILMADFQIPRNIPLRDRMRICLIVVQTDNLETSSCVISPQQVSFLVNGKAVERRTNIAMDTGPQFPTDITKMLKYGTNIIQAIGYFTGNYIIAIAFMSRIVMPDVPCLEDYVQPLVEKPVSDSDVIEGPSRIALNCPISFKRIKTPIKGHLCKHHQCFDYDNYMEMNSRKPSWRCPYCNTPTSYVDLRIDQKMVKILKEVGEDVSDIVVFADGSWKPIADYVSINQAHKGSSTQQETSMDHDSALDDIVDLTMVENDASNLEKFQISDNKAEDDCYELEDRKPSMDNEGLHIPLHASGASVAGSPMSIQATAYYTRDGTWPGCISSERTGATTVNTAKDVMLNPTQTEAVSSALNRGPTFSQPPISSMAILADNINLQQSNVGGAAISSEEARLLIPGRHHIPRNDFRTATAVQALPAQAQPHSSSSRIQSVASIGLALVSDEMQIDLYSRTSNMTSAALNLHSIAQEDHLQNISTLQQVGIPASDQIGNRATQVLPGVPAAAVFRAATSPPGYQLPHHQLVYNRRQDSVNPTCVSQLPGVPANQVQQASHSPVPAATSNQGTSPSMLMAARRAAQTATLLSGAARFPSISSRVASTPTPVHADAGGALPSPSSDGLLINIPYDENWRPSGRMRGSLTGGAYEAAINQYLVSPKQAAAQPRLPPPSGVFADQLPSFTHHDAGNDAQDP